MVEVPELHQILPFLLACFGLGLAGNAVRLCCKFLSALARHEPPSIDPADVAFNISLAMVCAILALVAAL